MVILLTLFFNKTRAGRALRACSQNREAAALLGIPVGAMLMLSFALSAALGAAAGILINIARQEKSPGKSGRPHGTITVPRRGSERMTVGSTSGRGRGR